MYFKRTVLIALCFVLCFLVPPAVFADCLSGNRAPTLTCDTPEEACTWPYYETIDYSFTGSVFDDDGIIVKLLYRRTSEDAFESVPFARDRYDFRVVLREGENRITICAIDNDGCSVFLERSIYGEESVPADGVAWNSLKAMFR